MGALINECVLDMKRRSFTVIINDSRHLKAILIKRMDNGEMFKMYRINGTYEVDSTIDGATKKFNNFTEALDYMGGTK